MKKLLCIFILLGFVSNVFSQNDAQYRHNMFNHMTINPGYAGSNDMININSLYRHQWMNMGNITPINAVFSVNMPFTLFDKEHGAGITVLNDNNPVITDIGVKLAYAYRMKMKIGDGKLGIGGSFGFYNSNFDASKLILGDGTSASTVVENKNTIYDVGMGVFYKTEKLYMGFSATHLINGEYKVDEKPMDFRSSHYYIAAGYVIPLSNPMFEFMPSFFIQNDGATTTINLNSNVMYNNRIWGGLSYRPGQAVTALFGVELLAGVKFGVAYDYETTDLSKVSDGSLEVAVIYSFKLKKEKIPQKYKSIRFL